MLVLLSLGKTDCNSRYRYTRNKTTGKNEASISTTTKAGDQNESIFLLNVVVRQGAVVLHPLAIIDKALLYRASAVHLIDLQLEIVDGI
jgi:hypothetical protein